MRKFLLTLCLLIGFTTLHAATATVNGITWTYQVSSGKVSITGCPTSTSGAITIPSTLGGYPVTSIGDGAFAWCESLTSVTIPESVTSIGDRAFYDCSSLTSFVVDSANQNYSSINDLLYSKDGKTLVACPGGLTSVTIPEGVTSIGDYAFDGCSGLTSVTIPSSVTSIGDYAFGGCKSLTSVTIPEGVTSIGRYAFYYCSRLTSVTIPPSVTSIGNYAFSECESLTSVNISDLAAWCGIAFKGSSSNPLTYAKKLYLNGELITDLVIPEGVTSIGSGAFDGCSRLTSVSIPSSVTSIGDYAFRSCSSLTSVTIPESVTSIGDEAFSSCKSLTSVTIPEGVTSIGNWAFYECSRLTSVNISDLAAWCGIEFKDSSSNPLTYAKKLYLNGELITDLVIPEGVTTIGGYAFCDCSRLTSVTIPEGVTSIGRGAFDGCSSLSSVTIPEGVTSIGDYAFLSCSSLTSVTIPSSVTSIGDYAFLSCSSLPKDENGVQYESAAKVVLIDVPTSMTGKFVIPSTVRFIHSDAFEYCRSLTSVTIPEGVTSIGNYAFSECSSLTSVTIPSSITSIGYDAFSGIAPTILTAAWLPNGMSKDNLKTVIIPSSVTSIGSSAFSGCSSLTSVTIPEGVTSIGNYAFEDCDSLTSVTIPEGVTSIGSGAFYNCSSLPKDENGVQYESAAKVVLIDVPTSMTGGFVIPNSVRFIHSSAFYYCRSLTSVTISDSVTSIGNYAFSGCSSLTSVTIPSSVTSIGSSAFSGCSSLTSVTIPSSVTSIGGGAFAYCYDLTSVHISDLAAWCKIAFESSDSNPLTYAEKLYLDGKLITNLVIPSSVTSIGDYAFYYCSRLTSVTIPEGVTFIGDYAFRSCSSLTSVTIPSSVTSIGSGAFYNCSSLPKDENGVQYESAAKVVLIDVPTSMTGEFAIPNSVRFIHSDAFYGCSSLTSVTIPEDVTSIEYRAYYNCSNLISVNFKGKPPSVGNEAFCNVSSFVTVFYSPKYASEWEAVIDSNSTWNGLKMVLQTALIFDANGGKGGQMVTQAPGSALVAPSVTREEYTFVGWLPKVPETVPTNPQTYVAQWVTNEDCFEYEVLEGNSIEITGLTKTSLEEVIIPSTIDGLPVASIGMDAFSDCEQIVSVILPEGITSIGDYAFYGCSNLNSIELPSTVRSIAISAFEDCETLTRVFFNGEPPGVGKQAFKGLPIEARGVYSSDMATAWEDVIKENGEWNGLTMVAPSALEVCITFDANGGEGGTRITQGYATALTAPSVACEGCFFAGWSPEVPAFVPLKDTVYKACWMSKRYTITFNANGGEGGKVITQDYATPLTAPQVTREDYTLTGWSPKVPETVPAENMTYTAQWTPKQYTITFDANGGEGGTSELLAWGSTLIPPTISRAGYTLTGWSPEVPTTVPAENITYTAQWTINQYTITFDAAGGEGGTSVTQDYDSALAAPQVTREGYTFKGWTPAVPSTVPAGNMTYTAQWTPKQYTITFDANGGEGGTTGRLECGAALIPPRVTHSKYEFIGWLPKVPATVPAGDTTYVAQWESNPALFTYDIYENEVTITGFAEGIAITEIIIPRWIEDLPVTMIGTSAFEGCTTLSTVVIPDGVIDIGRSAFRNCEGLTHVTLSSTISNVYAYAFSGCTNLKLIGFSASPIETVGKDAFANTTAVGTYLPQYASEWEAVIDANGKWNGLTMVQDGGVTLPEEVSEATGAWLTDVLEASGVTSGSAVLAEGTTAEALEAARLLGITPSVSVSGNIATVAAESTFEVSEVVVVDNAVSLAVTITVEAGCFPTEVSLGGVVKLMVCDTLNGEWTEVTPAPSQIILTRISDTEATLSVTQTLDAYQFFKVLVK